MGGSGNAFILLLSLEDDASKAEAGGGVGRFLFQPYIGNLDGFVDGAAGI
jgi:hypothetical protein